MAVYAGGRANVLSLCSGYGGLDIALRLALPPARTVCYVEREAYAATLLVARIQQEALDDAPIWSDLKTFDGRPWRGVVDILSGGYPCQPFSLAGKRAGTDDVRHLWPHIARIIDEIRPRICFFENVRNHINLGLREVLNDLRSLGYRVENDEKEPLYGIFSAAEVGAAHQRERLFIFAVAYPERHGRPEWWAESAQRPGRADATELGGPLANAEGIGRLQRGTEPAFGPGSALPTGAGGALADPERAERRAGTGEGFGSGSADTPGRLETPSHVAPRGGIVAYAARSLGAQQQGGPTQAGRPLVGGGAESDGRASDGGTAAGVQLDRGTDPAGAASLRDGAELADTGRGPDERRGGTGTLRGPEEGDQGLGELRQRERGGDTAGDGGQRGLADPLGGSGEAGPERSRWQEGPDPYRGGAGTGLADAAGQPQREPQHPAGTEPRELARLDAGGGGGRVRHLADAEDVGLQERGGVGGGLRQQQPTADGGGGALADADESGRPGRGGYTGRAEPQDAAAQGGGDTLADADGWGLRADGGPDGAGEPYPIDRYNFLPPFAPGRNPDHWRAILGVWPELAPALVYAGRPGPARLGDIGGPRQAEPGELRERTGDTGDGDDAGTDQEEAESEVRGVADGPYPWMVGRTEQLRAGGNGVVPIEAAFAFSLLAARAGLPVPDPLWGSADD